MSNDMTNTNNCDDEDRDYVAEARERERTICPICNSGNGHSLSCATLNVARDVIELDAFDIQDRPERLLPDRSNIRS